MDTGSNFPLVFFRLESEDDRVPSARNKLEGGEAVKLIEWLERESRRSQAAIGEQIALYNERQENMEVEQANTGRGHSHPMMEQDGM